MVHTCTSLSHDTHCVLAPKVFLCSVELLLSKGYEVHGIIRRSSSFNTNRLQHLYADQHEREHQVQALPHFDLHRSGPNKFKLHYGDLSDSTNLVYILAQVQPTEIYNLGAQSHVKVSFEMAEYTADVDGLGTLRLLDAIRTVGLEKHVRFYQASTSELYGKVVETPQSETTPFYPRSPYGVAKLYAYWITVNYREAYGMYACNGILFNHESPRRGRTFVTRKITRAVADISLGKQHCLYLGNLDARRDWGHGRCLCCIDLPSCRGRELTRANCSPGLRRGHVEDAPAANCRRLCPRNGRNTPRARVCREGVCCRWHHHQVCCLSTASLASRTDFFFFLSYHRWRGTDLSEEGYDEKTGRVVVKIDPTYFRPAEVECVVSMFLPSLRADESPPMSASSMGILPRRSVCWAGNARWTLTRSSRRWSPQTSRLPRVLSRIRTDRNPGI